MPKYATLKERFDEKWICSMGGCFEWLGARSGGRAYISYKGASIQASRVAWLLGSGEWPGDMDVLHKCDNGACVRFDHLFLGSQKDNMNDCISKGRLKIGSLRGQDHVCAKLDNEDILFIREQKPCAHTYRSLADRFSVHEVTIFNIMRRKTWGHI